MLRLLAGLLLPLAVFYGLRAAGAGAYTVLVAGTALSLVDTAVDLARKRSINPVTLL
ncbi:hypothetical protein [Arthrobacter sp. Z1-15]